MPQKRKTHARPGQQTRKEKNAEYDKKRRDENEGRKLYSLARWRHPKYGLRRHILDRDPWCARCALKGIVTHSDTVNHKVAHKGDPELFWDEANLEGVCSPCHSSDIQKEEVALHGPNTPARERD